MTNLTKRETFARRYEWFVLASIVFVTGIALFTLDTTNVGGFLRLWGGSLLILLSFQIVAAVFSKPTGKNTEDATSPQEGDEELRKWSGIANQAQYERLGAEIRTFEGLLWQIPSFSLTVAAALVVGALQFISERTARFLVLSLAVLFLFLMGQVTIKHRFAIGVRQELLRDIEVSWGRSPIPAGVNDQLNYLNETTRRKEVLARIKGRFTPEKLIRWSSHLLFARLLFVAGLLVLIVAVIVTFWPTKAG